MEDMNMQWISVEDRLPPDGAYLCSKGTDYIGVCYRFPSIEDGKFRCLETDKEVNVSHWMPLPKPPTE